VRDEKPHIGNCGVPFMKSTTGALLISVLIRSLIGLLDMPLLQDWENT
jgi:hypothetical protein